MLDLSKNTKTFLIYMHLSIFLRRSAETHRTNNYVCVYTHTYTQTRIQTYGRFRGSSQATMYESGLWEEARGCQPTQALTEQALHVELKQRTFTLLSSRANNYSPVQYFGKLLEIN